MSRDCKLLAGPAEFSAQAVLAVIAVGALVWKRHRERPQRPLKVWYFDLSKQVASTAAAHFAGMFIAIVMASTRVSQCAWYFVAFTFDTTLGVAIALGLHTAAVKTAKKLSREELQSGVLHSIANCGNYGTPPELRHLWPQLLEFTVAVLIARLCCGTLIFLLREALIHFAHLLDDAFRGHPLALLYFVMIACPLVMNLLQALIQDTVLKRKRPANEGQKTGFDDAQSNDSVILLSNPSPSSEAQSTA